MNQNSSAQSSGTEQSDSSDFKITVLSPSEDLKDNESYKSYENRLAAALKHKLVFNIALTGIYGSGKSSILNTFKKSYKDNSEWRFLEVSLSTFKVEKISEGDQTDEESVDKGIRGLTPDKIQLIERSILQQFFYAVPQSDIPLSRFKRITENSKETYRITLWVIVLTLWSYIYAFNQAGFITELVEFAEWYQYLNLIILILCTLFIINKIYSYSFGLTEIKFNLHNAEFNIKNEQEKSILNDHLDEILYFFETTGKNIVIIEDLDRFNDTEIFIRLRELNSIINKSCPHRVVFIYAIRDDVFKDNERSKFFDYIIPVIPIINPTNAYDLIQRNYKEVVQGIDKRFLRNSCLYFDDMRLLKNVINEYQVYSDQLNILNIDKNKIFAMVVYKNYYPDEFSKLNSNNGEIYNIFYKKKSEVVDKLTEDKSKEITELNHRKNEIASESLVSIDELNSIYAYTILKKLKPLQRTNYNNLSIIQVEANSKVYNVSDISTTEVLKELTEHQDINLNVTNTSFNINFKFNEVEDEVDSEKSYIDRLFNIVDKNNNELSRISNRIFEVKNEIQNIKNQRIVEILKQTEISISKPILGYFVKNGFIDETYQDYISYFFEESISLNDKNYALLVNSFGEPNFELDLKNYDELVESYLGVDKLSTHSALNFTMLDFMLNNTRKKVYIEKYIETICDGSDLSKSFLKNYFKRDKNLSLLIPKIVDVRENIIDEINIYNNTEEARFNLKRLIRHLPLKSYEELPYLTECIKGELNLLRDYVSFILDCFDSSIDKFQEFTDTVQPVLKNATFSKSQVKELNWLGGNRYLAINKHMIKQILINNLEDPDTAVADLEVKPVTLMANSGINYLTENIWSEKLSEYIRVILLGADEPTSYSENEDVYIKALNILDSLNSIVEKFIDANSTKVKNISKVKNAQIKKYLIGSLKVQYSWSNVFRYFSESYEDQDDQGVYREIDSSLIKFLESGQSYLKMVDYIESDIVNIEDWQSIKAEFDKHLFVCDHLSDEAYEKLIAITDNNWDNSKLENISQEKIRALISLGKLNLTPENWEQVKEYASKEVVLAFLIKNIEVIINDLDFIQVRPQDIVSLLFSEDIINNNKRFLVENIGVDLISIGEHIRKKILRVYGSDRIPITIYEQFIEHADSNELKKLLLNQIESMNNSEIMRVLSLLDEPYQTLTHGTEVEFEDSEENRAILNKLNIARIVRKFPKPKRPQSNPIGKKVLTTRLQSHILGN